MWNGARSWQVWLKRGQCEWEAEEKEDQGTRKKIRHDYKAEEDQGTTGGEQKHKKKTAGKITRKRKTRKRKRKTRKRKRKSERNRERKRKRESDLAACFPDKGLLSPGGGNQIWKCVSGCWVLQRTCLDF